MQINIDKAIASKSAIQQDGNTVGLDPWHAHSSFNEGLIQKGCREGPMMAGCNFMYKIGLRSQNQTIRNIAIEFFVKYVCIYNI